MISAEVSAQLQAYKAKQQAGTITLEELRHAVNLMREGRAAASLASASSTGRKRIASEKASVNIDDLLGELENLPGVE